MNPDPARKILESYKTFAVVGCSSDPWRASHGVAQQRDRAASAAA